MTPTKESAPGQEGRGQSTSDACNPTESPTMPMAHTIRAAVLGTFQQGGCLTQADAIKQGYGWRLAAIVHALRGYGWPIETVRIDRGRGHQPIAMYYLPPAGGAR